MSKTPAASKNTPLIVLHIANEELAMDLSAVNRVIEIDHNKLCPVPLSPNIILGITNYWGKIITVIDTAHIINQEQRFAPKSELSPLIILEKGQKQVGLLAKGINEIVTSYEKKSLETKAEGVISQIFELNNRAVGLLSIQRLMNVLKDTFEGSLNKQ